MDQVSRPAFKKETFSDLKSCKGSVSLPQPPADNYTNYALLRYESCGHYKATPMTPPNQVQTPSVLPTGCRSLPLQESHFEDGSATSYAPESALFGEIPSLPPKGPLEKGAKFSLGSRIPTRAASGTAALRSVAVDRNVAVRKAPRGSTEAMTADAAMMMGGASRNRRSTSQPPFTALVCPPKGTRPAAPVFRQGQQSRPASTNSAVRKTGRDFLEPAKSLESCLGVSSLTHEGCRKTATAYIFQFVSSRGYKGSLQSIQQPMSPDVTSLLQFLMDKAEWTYSHLPQQSQQKSGSVVERCTPDFFKDMGYPFSIARSHMISPTIPMTWYQILAAITWLCVLLSFKDKLMARLRRFDASACAPRVPPSQQPSQPVQTPRVLASRMFDATNVPPPSASGYGSSQHQRIWGSGGTTGAPLFSPMVSSRREESASDDENEDYLSLDPYRLSLKAIRRAYRHHLKQSRRLLSESVSEMEDGDGLGDQAAFTEILEVSRRQTEEEIERRREAAEEQLSEANRKVLELSASVERVKKREQLLNTFTSDLQLLLEKIDTIKQTINRKAALREENQSAIARKEAAVESARKELEHVKIQVEKQQHSKIEVEEMRGQLRKTMQLLTEAKKTRSGLEESHRDLSTMISLTPANFKNIINEKITSQCSIINMYIKQVPPSVGPLEPSFFSFALNLNAVSDNDFKKQEARSNPEKILCALMNNLRFEDWVLSLEGFRKRLREATTLKTAESAEARTLLKETTEKQTIAQQRKTALSDDISDTTSMLHDSKAQIENLQKLKNEVRTSFDHRQDERIKKIAELQEKINNIKNSVAQKEDEKLNLTEILYQQRRKSKEEIDNRQEMYQQHIDALTSALKNLSLKITSLCPQNSEQQKQLPNLLEKTEVKSSGISVEKIDVARRFRDRISNRAKNSCAAPPTHNQEKEAGVSL